MARKVAFSGKEPDDPPAENRGANVEEKEEGQEVRREQSSATGNRDSNDPSPRSETREQTHRNNDKHRGRLKHNPQLFDSARAPRYPIVLCHGLYGFDVRGPESFPKFRMHYWFNVMNILKRVGAEVVVTGVPGTASISSRAERMDRFLQEKVKRRDINFIAHSMGGLDCRHLITHIRPQEYKPLSLTSLSAPHRGSPFMDWCMANIGIGSPRPFPFPLSSSSSSSLHTPRVPPSSHKPKRTIPYSLSSPLLGRASPSNNTQPSTPSPSTSSASPPPSTSDSKLGSRLNILHSLPSSVTSLILSLIDSPAYSNLTTSFLRDSFNLYTPDDPSVKYFSVAAHVHKMSIWHPLWIPKMIVDAAEELEREESREDAFASQMQGQGPEMTLSYPHSHNRHAPEARSDRNASDTTMLRGNDGLVPITSAKWGTFLGVIEGCNHWDIRGAGGLGSISDNSREGESSRSGDKGGGSGIGLNRVGLDFDWEEGWKLWRDWVGAVSRAGENKAEKVNKEKAQAEYRTSTHPSLSSSTRLNNDDTASSDIMTFPTQTQSLKFSPKQSTSKNEDSPTWAALNGFSDGRRFDLERFYVALCRKLYDEGL